MLGLRGLKGGVALVLALVPACAAAASPAEVFLQDYHAAIFGIRTASALAEGGRDSILTWPLRIGVRDGRLSLARPPRIRLRLDLLPARVMPFLEGAAEGSGTASLRSTIPPLTAPSLQPYARENPRLLSPGILAAPGPSAVGEVLPHFDLSTTTAIPAPFVPPLLLLGAAMMGDAVAQAPLRLGPLQMTEQVEHFEESGVEPFSLLSPLSPPTLVRGSGTLVGSRLVLPVGERPLAFDLTSGDARLFRQDALLDARTVNAALAVPAGAFTLGVGYDTQHLLGTDLLTGMPYDARSDLYLGSLRYRLPSGNVLTLTARQNRYQDNLIPGLDLTQVGAKLDFTITF